MGEARTLADALSGRRLVFFCGKGGVGKTTLAAACALALGARGTRCLLLGTDPAGTLPRVLGAAGAAVEAAGREGAAIGEGARARQIDAGALQRAFRAEVAPTVASIIEGGTYLDAKDAAELCERSLPGVDEVLSLLELAEAVERDAVVLVDTAPSAHALRLLSLPRLFEAALAVLGAMREKARVIEEALAGGDARETEADRLLASLGGRVRALRALLSDAAGAGFVAIVRPDPSSAAEARRMGGELAAMGMTPLAVIANAFDAEEGAPCCARGAARREAGRESIAEAGRAFAGAPAFRLGTREGELVGVEELGRLGEEALSTVATSTSSGTGTKAAGAPSEAARSAAEWRELLPPPEAATSPPRLFLVGGKGGVGKSTVAAALALARASEAPPRRVLVASIGGAGGLGRVLDAALSDEPRALPGAPSLSAAEVDSRARFDRLKEGFREDVERALDSLVGGGALDLTYDRAIVKGLLDLAPPGVDEIAGLAFLLDEAGAFDEVVLDCAPTGHLVRFLELPRLARSWLALALELLRKYPELGSAGAVEKTVGLLRRVREAANLLLDPARTALVLVSLPERIPAEETASLAGRAGERGVRPALSIVNRVTPPTGCPRCEARRARELAIALEIGRALPETPAATIDDAPAEPRGAARLRGLALHPPPASAA